MNHLGFFEAIEAGDLPTVQGALAGEPSWAGAWRPTDHGWESPLHVAARSGRLAVVMALVEAGAEVYAAFPGGYPPVDEALSHRHQEVAEYLMGRAGDLPPTYGAGIDLILAARHGLVGSVRKHLERDPLAVYRRGCIGESVLHWPAHNGFVNVLELLLDAGAKIEADEIGLYGGKPLHWAAEHAPACVRLLLERGADPRSRNLMGGEFEGFTPLHMCASQPNQCVECAELLLAAGANRSDTDAQGRTPLGVAQAAGRTDMARFLAA